MTPWPSTRAVAAVAFLVLPAGASAAPGYVEDFQSTAARDSAATTADWNLAEGELNEAGGREGRRER